MIRLSLAASALALVLSIPVAAEPVSREPFARGMIVSCPMAGRIWGSPAMAETLQELDEIGVRWVSIHPYAWIRRSGRVEPYEERDTSFLRRAVQMARERRMQLFWKPHLGYWGSFEWRGAIEFGENERAWRRFFDDYGRFIVAQAELAEEWKVEIFAIGVELEGTVHRPEWRGLIERVREVYSGKLLYAANWDRIEDVPFWGELDLIGVHAYFPLSHHETPSRAELAAGWDRHLERLSALSHRHGGMRVLFAEIGYNRSTRAASEPWDYRVIDTGATRALRRDLIEVALERLPKEPYLAGLFWWKWMPGGGRDQHDRNFSMKDPEAREALESYWSGR